MTMTGITKIEKCDGSASWIASQGFAEVWFCDHVEWDAEGHMITGPRVFARKTDGAWVESVSWIVLCRTGGDACAEPDGSLDVDAANRMRGHFAGLGLPYSAGSI